MEVTWLAALREEAEKTSKAEAGKKIGYSRTAVSLALAGKYRGGTEKLAAAVLKNLVGRVACPFYGTDISADKCDEHSRRPMSTSSPHDLKLWRACQGCKANQGGQDAA